MNNTPVTPDTDLKLIHVPIEIDNLNQLTFPNATTQFNYFNGLNGIEITDITYQRKDGIIRVPYHIDDIISYNYCTYINNNYTNKRYYCFITNMRYIGDSVTEVSIKTDVFQTYQFDIVYKHSFIEREHVINDTIGLHTLPENLETGEYIVNTEYVDPNLDNFLDDTSYVIGASVDINSSTSPYPFTGGGVYNGIYSGVKYYAYKFSPGSSPVQAINQKLQEISENGQADTITGIFIVPSFLAPVNASGAEITNTDSPYSYTFQFPKTYGLNGYTPKNNKLYTHPFCYILGMNMNGNSNIYRYEDFSQNYCEFEVKGVLCPGGSIRLVPHYYKGIWANESESLILGKYPICNYSVDMYTNWLTQNSVNIAGSTISSDDINISNANIGGLTNILSTLASGNILGVGAAFSNAHSDIANALIAKKQHELIPPSVRGNLNAGDVISSDNKNNFRFLRMSIKAEYAKCIDEYFSMYGYLINEVKMPNINTRVNWNYVKTINCNLEGNIPQEDLQEIKNIYNNGVTLWHNPNTFLDYSQNNPNQI